MMTIKELDDGYRFIVCLLKTVKKLVEKKVGKPVEEKVFCKAIVAATSPAPASPLKGHALYGACIRKWVLTDEMAEAIASLIRAMMRAKVRTKANIKHAAT